MRFYDYLIVGAGLTGSVLAERLASQLGRRVLVVDRRDHVAGNTYDRLDAHGVLVHQYGPHLFHTNSAKVWTYLSQFTAWHPYEHRVLAEVDGRRVPVPFNLTSLHALFPAVQAERLERLLKATFGDEAKVAILKLREAALDPARALSAQDGTDLQALADFIYEKVFYGYTVKQWDLTPEQLGPTVMSRVPVHVSRDDRYFQDTYQALPADGYTGLVRRLLDHPNIHVVTGTDAREAEQGARFDRMIYTGAIDAFFDHVHGPLPYRSLRFEFEHFAEAFVQERAQVNFPNAPGDGPAYTRITEFKHATGQRVKGTTVAREYPCPHVPGANEAYYPIPMAENQALFARYAEEAARLNGTVVFAGRLADYQYYNMDQAVARALTVFERHLVPA